MGAIPSQSPAGEGPSHQPSAEHYSLVRAADVLMFSFQVGMMQMAADKNNVKK